MLYVTPSHQYPMGGILSLERRSAVLAWAASHDALVIEDDYDSEFRFGRAPIPALASLDRTGRVAYVGTLSKSLSPWLRLGFVVAEPDLVRRMLRVRQQSAGPVPGIVQAAIEKYIRSGGLQRHVNRQRRVYADRRERVVRGLNSLPAVAGISGMQAGLHATVMLDDSVRSSALVQEARRSGLLIADLDDYRLDPDPHAPGIVLGYGSTSPASLERALSILRAVLA